MPIFQQYDALFIHIPRTGGTNLENILELNCTSPNTDVKKLFGRSSKNGEWFNALQHLTCRAMLVHSFLPRKRFENLFKFTIVRNPYYRCASLYYFWGGNEKWGTLENFLSHLKSLHPDTYDHHSGHYGPVYHVLPQYQYIYDENGEVLVDFIARFENYTDDIHRLFAAIGFTTDDSIFNTSQRRLKERTYFELYDEAALKLVQEIYARDLELFHYSFHLGKPDNLNIPRPLSGYRLEKCGKKLMLYHHNTSLACLNETAALIWLLCDGQRNLVDIRNLLQEAYPQMADSIAQDIQSVLEQFIFHGAIEFL